MFHCNGWCFPYAVTAVAGTHVCLRKVEPGRIWELLEAERVTHYCGAPTVHIGVVNDPAAHRLEQPVQVPTGGAPPSPTLLSRMQDLNLHPQHLYGLTESYGPHTSCTWDPAWDERPAEDRRGSPPARARPSWPANGCGWPTTTARTSRATARRSARSCCVATPSWPATTSPRS